MPGEFVFAVDVLGVFGVDLLHDEADVGGFGFNEQVRVVGHEAVGVQFERVFVFDFEEDALVGVIVFRFEKDDAAAVSSGGDVVHGSGEPDSWVSWHGGWCSFRGWDMGLSLACACVGNSESSCGCGIGMQGANLYSIRHEVQNTFRGLTPKGVFFYFFSIVCSSMVRPSLVLAVMVMPFLVTAMLE